MFRSGSQQLVISKEIVQTIVLKIEASTNGWFRIQTDNKSPFIQASYQLTYPNCNWFIDSYGDEKNLEKLGFKKTKNDNPMMWVSRKDVVDTIVKTLYLACEIKMGQSVLIDFELLDTEKTIIYP